MADELTLGFSSDCGDPDVAALRLARVRGHERLSQIYEYELWLESTQDQGLALESLEAMLRHPCRFTIGDATISGVLDQITLEPTTDSTRTTYHVLLVPRLARLARTERSRVFQDMTAPAVIEAILTAHQIPFQSSYLAEYPAREYTVQYEESDLDFVRRLAEHWGVFFFFEQQPDGEVVTLADDNKAFVAHEGHATLTYASHGDATSAAHIGPMERTLSPQTASVTLRDYNWRTPFAAEDGSQTERQLQLTSTAAVDEATGSGQHRRYGDHFKDDAEGLLLSTVRAQEMLVDRLVHRGGLHAPGLAPGHRFSTTGMPIAELEGEYVLTAIETSVDKGGETNDVEQRFEAIPSDVAFRAPRMTERPVIVGHMHAVVDGEVIGVAAPIDEYGRYKVIMPFDEAAASGGRASRWIRMAQASAGADYGMHLPLHIGTEVLVTHLDGDPERPVIVGAVPNVDTMSPVVDANATQSRIRTSTGILFELEDDA
ncbi:MAG: type VI secretion system tip protein VgrG [Sandaracinaceae bacterium]|nr:type VI secretion system tip protein VgrG [Sandaracinaceae bacterium]